MARLTIDLAQATDNWRGAVFYLDQLASLDTAAWPADTPAARQAVTRTAALAQAQEALRVATRPAARWPRRCGAAAHWPYPARRWPASCHSGRRCRYRPVSTSSPWHWRRVRHSASWPATLQRAVADARTVPGVAAALEDSVDPSQLVVTIRFSGPADLRDKRTRLANLIAAEPDLALLHALLAVRDLDLTTTTATFWQTQQLTDTLDLPAVYRAWTDQARVTNRPSTVRATRWPTVHHPAWPRSRVLWQVEGAAWQTWRPTAKSGTGPS
ncbi:MAG: hypothetical protein HZY76_05410 [Anaerolineae bacterium]|nr:MAG: hypothetical protein HZY76_05410 [Anaerolineae bacterium]